jgi:hypothetical protein
VGPAQPAGSEGRLAAHEGKTGHREGSHSRAAGLSLPEIEVVGLLVQRLALPVRPQPPDGIAELEYVLRRQLGSGP